MKSSTENQQCSENSGPVDQEVMKFSDISPFVHL